MTTLAQLRRTALSLPETAERESGPGLAAFTVRDKRFAAVDRDQHVRLHLPSGERDEMLAAQPTAALLYRGETPFGVRVPLSDIDGRQLDHWVRRAWLTRAPRRLAAQVAATDATAAGDVGDLPRAIGRPATRALAAAGILTLADVSTRTEEELLALHGVGSKAVRILGEALRTGGRSFAG
ncbi:hypothetical protein [Streptomyces sp. NPDC053755]|uniref:hypothetical protein n=1 Tax=Streptomyces sp. NPDC053755 TaxID=3155815 RepID=UPI003431BC28